MTRRATCVIVAMLAARAAAAEPDLLSAAGLKPAGLERYWQVSLPLVEGESLTALHQTDEHLYGVTDQSVLFAVEADTGVIRWAKQVALPGDGVFRPTHRTDARGERQVVVATSTHMRMYELRYGDVRGAFSVSTPPSTAAVADETRIYFGSINARFSCFQIQGGLRFWQVLTGGPLSATPQIHDDEIYFASQGGGIFVALKENKSGRWKAQAGTGIHGDLAIDADRVYAASKDRNVYAFDRITGDVKWMRQLPAPLFDGPVRSRDTLYQTAGAAGLFALDPATGTVRWSRPGHARVVGVGEGRVYLTDETGQGVVAESGTGKVLATFEAAAAELALTNVRDDALYFASRRGTIICVRRRDAPPMGRTQLALASAKKPKPAAGTATQPAGAAVELPDPARAVLQDPFRSRATVAPLTGRPGGGN